MIVKADFHLHSPFSRPNGDNITWESLYDSLIKLSNKKIKIASFTDHSVFNYQFYKKTFNLGKTGNIIFLPGIEVNVRRLNGVIANLLILFDWNLEDSKLIEIEKITKKYLKKEGVTIKQINNLFTEFNTIRIPHIGKSDFFSVQDLRLLKFDAGEISNANHNNYKKFLKSELKDKYPIVSFSDTHNWLRYPQISSFTTYIEMESYSFEALKKAFINKNIFIRKE